jgi:hypothetical protein
MTSTKKKKTLIEEKENSYQETREFERNETSVTSIREVMIETNEIIESLIERLRDMTNLSIRAKSNDVRTIENDYAETLTKLINELILTQKHLQKEIIK